MIVATSFNIPDGKGFRFYSTNLTPVHGVENQCSDVLSQNWMATKWNHTLPVPKKI